MVGGECFLGWVAMMSLNAWNITPDAVTLEYHTRQHASPYRSTVHFSEFIRESMANVGLCVDAGCGAGGPTNYLATCFPAAQFVGIDQSQDLIDRAEAWPGRAANTSFKRMSLENIEPIFGVDAVVLMQVLSWLPEYVTPLHQIRVRLKPRWIAFSTLLYAGDIDCQIVVTEHQRPRKSYHNIYGVARMAAFMIGEGYALTKLQKFDIDIDLPEPPTPHFMQTYTAGPSRAMFSGPLYLPWGFALFEKATANGPH
jgi:SAM-dependent methyltransferase